MDLSEKLIKINNSLSTQGVSLRIEQRGSLLNLRGPLPSKSGEGSHKDQRISLSIAATNEGLIEAQRTLDLVLIQLQHKQFDWTYWSNRQSNKTNKDNHFVFIEALRDFEKSFFRDPQRRKNLSSTKTTWQSAYLPYLRRLKKISEKNNYILNTNILNETLLSYLENSRSRQQCATTLGIFAKHFDINLPEEWRVNASGYGIKHANYRELPSDNLIKAAYNKIPNPRWKLVYGIMATYGLRNHEVFFSDLSSLNKGADHIIRVLPNTKTGEHEVWPFHPEWTEFFGLDDIGGNKDALPPINKNLQETTLQQVGRRVAEQFRRYQLPLTPYDLRHAWAIRTIHIGLPDTVSARMMGHSVAIHNRTYHHWITRRDQQKAVDAALSRKKFATNS